MRSAYVVYLSLFLTACGGGESGSGGGTGVAPTPTPPPAPTPTPTPTPSTGFNPQAAASYALSNGARAVVVVERGSIVLEQYANGGSATRGETLASGTKSFTCVLAAAGEDDGFFTITERVASVLPPWAAGGSAPQNAQKQQIRAVDLLAVTSGLGLGGASGGALNDVDSYAQVVDAPSLASPDTATIYNPNNAQGFSLFFELRTGGSYGAGGTVTGGRDGINYLQTRVFDRIGIRPTEWERDTRGKPNFAGGASMTARDWARFGQFMEQSGLWNGTQVVSAARLQNCVTYRSGAFAGYGLGWWLNRPVGSTYVPSRDSLPWGSEVTSRWAAGGKFAPSAPDDMFAAFGFGQRKLYVIPSRDLVIVRIGGPTEEDPFFQLLFGTG